MKAEDLRRGNLILTSKDAGGKKFLRSIVQEITATYVIVDGDRKVMLEDCEGISLSEEWLLKCGFERENNRWEMYIDEFHVVFNGQIFLEGTGIDIKYVHQLQNLYYVLTGEELKILTPVS